MTVTLVMRRARDLARLLRGQEGQAMVEYALLIALVALAAFGAVNFFGLGVSSLYSKIVDHFPK